MSESSYTLPSALGELVDNAIEANANRIDVWFEETHVEGLRKQRISEIFVVDDGDGMGIDEEGRDILYHCLQLGYSTHFMSEKTIGKFGVGATLGGLSIADRIDLWSRTDAEEIYRHCCLDLAKSPNIDNDAVTLRVPDGRPVPDEVEHLLPEAAGTVIRWSGIDPRDHVRWAADIDTLRVDVEKELARIFRYFINGGIEIRVQGRQLVAHDPLFLMERTWADKTITEQLQNERRRRVKRAAALGQDPPAGTRSANHFEARVIARRKISCGRGRWADVTVTLHPSDVTHPSVKSGDALTRRLRIEGNAGFISFVRKGRELCYAPVANSLPGAARSMDQFIGIEVAFSPELDQYFGVSSVKRRVEPGSEVLSQLRHQLSGPIEEARSELQRRWAKLQEQEGTDGEHTAVTQVIAETDHRRPKSRAQRKGPNDDRERALRELAKDLGKFERREVQAYVRTNADRAIVIESVRNPGASFLDIRHVNRQVIVRLNILHAFYRDFYAPIRLTSELEPGVMSGIEAVQTARQARTALTLLLAAYAKAESMHREPMHQYGEVRNFWSAFLDSMTTDCSDLSGLA